MAGQESKSSLSNLRRTQLKPAKLPSREAVEENLKRLHLKLQVAKAEHDNGTERMTRRDIDDALELFHRCPDPAGVADPTEWGGQGVGPT